MATSISLNECILLTQIDENETATWLGREVTHLKEKSDSSLPRLILCSNDKKKEKKKKRARGIGFFLGGVALLFVPFPFFQGVGFGLMMKGTHDVIQKDIMNNIEVKAGVNF